MFLPGLFFWGGRCHKPPKRRCAAFSPVPTAMKKDFCGHPDSYFLLPDILYNARVP